MTRLLLVRHAHPSANWDQAVDAGLDGVGDAQARALVGVLAPRGPLPIVTSPLRRTRETAAPLAEHWGRTPRVEHAVGEIPSPVEHLAARGAWLREVLAGRWSDVGPELHRWRAALLDALLGMEAPTMIVSHYVAINTAVGAATGDDRLTTFSPAHTSITELVVEDGTLRLVALGDEGTTTIR
jgi:broad specificity phosphatase PhoE